MLLFKAVNTMLNEARVDLERPHDYAAERVGFLICKPGRIKGGYVLAAVGYVPVEDAHYIKNREMGAVIGAPAFRGAMQLALDHKASIVHVHLHTHYGQPRFSKTDSTESEMFVPTFWNVLPHFPHGALVLSYDSMYGRCWLPEGRKSLPFDELVSAGKNLMIGRP